MAAAARTPNLNLPQWVNNESLIGIMNDLNAALLAIDKAVVKNAAGNISIGSGSSDLNNIIQKLTIATNGASGSGIGIYSYQSASGVYVPIGAQYSPSNTNNGSQIRFGIDVGGDTHSFLGFVTTNGEPIPSERMRINAAGNVGIGTINPTSPLYIVGNCSADSFTDRTPFFDGDALSEIKKIKGKDGKIDHSTLPEFVHVKKEKIIEPEVMAQKEVKAAKATKTQEAVEYKAAVEAKSAVIEMQDERDLGAMISMLTIAVQQLADEIELLKKNQT